MFGKREPWQKKPWWRKLTEREIKEKATWNFFMDPSEETKKRMKKTLDKLEPIGYPLSKSVPLYNKYEFTPIPTYDIDDPVLRDIINNHNRFMEECHERRMKLETRYQSVHDMPGSVTLSTNRPVYTQTNLLDDIIKILDKKRIQ